MAKRNSLSDSNALSLNDAQPDRLAEPTDSEQPPRLPFPVVGIGASAGGLEAFIEFFKAVRPDSGMAYVLIQHLPPDRESMVADLLSKHTTIPVDQIDDGMALEPNHVYVIRPGRTVTIHNGKLHLGEPLEKRGHQRPVDDFFRSLAEEQRQRAIAIVLSGMGSNGTSGAETVKAVGGLCIAQEPDGAKFPSMPRSLIESGLADFVLRAPEIPEALVRYASHPYAQGIRPTLDEARNKQALSEILGVLRARLRHDFSGYKKPTLLRRIQRRMGLNQMTQMVEYSRLLRQSPSESTTLADDLMIHVTGFFRDPEVWETLQQKVIIPAIAERSEDTPFRAWVTACASGEEAYTLAILIVEAAEQVGKRLDIKVFSTDTAERSLNQARAGVFPGGIESEISPERLERFFDKDDAHYRVKKQLRELVVFAPQNLLQDPPFSRLDICTCRNLLIYLEPAEQRRALALMHFGLRDGGTLLLGNSETVGDSDELFEPLDKKLRIYRRVGPTRHGTVDFPLPHSLTNPVDAEQSAAPILTRASIAQLTQKALVERYTPPAVVIDRQHRIVYYHGSTERYLIPPRGEPTRELLPLVRDEFRGAVRSAIHNSIAQNESVTVRDGVIESLEGRKRVQITAAPLEVRMTPSSYFLVSFAEVTEPEIALAAMGGAQTTPDHRQLERELEQVRSELQSTIEELQTSNEEMKASAEESTSINEELQSANEELETSKEELQSLNEELTTVNTQLQTKMEELEAMTSDLSSLLSSTDIAVVFLDTTFRIRRFTPAVRDLFELIPSDAGRPLNDLARKFTDAHLTTDAQQVLERLVPIEREVIGLNGRTYVRRALAYRTNDNRIEGVVLTFIDITARKRAEDELRANEERSRLILDGIKEYAIFMLDRSGAIATWTAGAERLLGFTASEAIGRSLALIVPPEEGGEAKVDTELRRALEKGSVIEEGWHVKRDGTRFWGSGLLAVLKPDGEQPRGYVKVLRDNTDRKRSEQSLQLAKRAADAANEAKDHFLATVSHELRTPLSAIVLWTSLIEDQKIVDPKQLAEALGAIKRSAEEQRQLIEDLVDTSRIVAGKLRLEIRDTHLPTVVHDGVMSACTMAKEKNIHIEETLDPKVNTVQADGNRILQVVSNLVNNAVKFTPVDGQIRVDLRRFGDEVRIIVSDTGIGMERESLPHIFERFMQVEGASTRTQTGLGLGLAITKQIVEMHGGSIRVESPGVGRGSTFTVSIPLPTTETNNGMPQRGASQIPNLLKGVSILLVEDVASTRRALAAVLQEAGAKVWAADSAPAAWETFEKERPQLIVSDLGLPMIDGYALIRQIRESEESGTAPRLPAIALTAFAGDTVIRKAMNSGFQSCLTKPIDAQRLVSTLAGLLASERAQAQAAPG